MPITTFLSDRSPTRGLISLALSDTGKVLKRKEASDGGGGTTDTYEAQSEIPCRIDPVGGSEGEVADRISDRTTHVITLYPKAEVTLDDDFEVVGVGRFEITAIRSRTSERVRIIEVTDQS